MSARWIWVGYNHLISNKREWNNCFIKNAPKYRKLDYNKTKRPNKNHAYARHFCRSWYNGSFTVMSKPMKTLELHYPMIQFLITTDIFRLTLQYILLHPNEATSAGSLRTPLPVPSRLSYTSETGLHQRTHFLDKPHQRSVSVSLERKTWWLLECCRTSEPDLEIFKRHKSWFFFLFAPQTPHIHNRIPHKAQKSPKSVKRKTTRMRNGPLHHPLPTFVSSPFSCVLWETRFLYLKSKLPKRRMEFDGVLWQKWVEQWNAHSAPLHGCIATVNCTRLSWYFKK